MERYIDAEILKNKILDDMAKAEREGKDLNGYTDSLFHLKTTPTADVVPKSEYDNLKFQFEALDHECDRMENAESKRHDAIEQAKSEVAREIFEEIEKLHLHITNEFDLRRYEELKKKYTEAKSDE